MVILPLVVAALLGYHFRDWQESVGDRLRRECASILDASEGVETTTRELDDAKSIMNERPDVRTALELARPGFWDDQKRRDFKALHGDHAKYPPGAWEFEFYLNHPAWKEALAEALERQREPRIRACVLKRGLGR